MNCQSLSSWLAWIALLWSTLKPSISAIVENSIGPKDEGWAYRLSEATLQGFNLRLIILHLSEYGASGLYKEATLCPSEPTRCGIFPGNPPAGRDTGTDETSRSSWISLSVDVVPANQRAD